MAKELVVKQERLPSAESRRLTSDIDEHVVYGAPGAAHQLGLAATATTMHSPNYTACRAGLGILDKRGGCASPDVVVEYGSIECPSEEPTPVVVCVIDQNQHIREVRWLDPHRAIVT